MCQWIISYLSCFRPCCTCSEMNIFWCHTLLSVVLRLRHIFIWWSFQSRKESSCFSTIQCNPSIQNLVCQWGFLLPLILASLLLMTIRFLPLVLNLSLVVLSFFSYDLLSMENYSYFKSTLDSFLTCLSQCAIDLGRIFTFQTKSFLLSFWSRKQPFGVGLPSSGLEFNSNVNVMYFW